MRPFPSRGSAWNALDEALNKGNHKIVALLLDRHPQLIDSVRFHGFTGLYTAAHQGHDKAIAEILSRKPKPHAAVRAGRVQVVAQLLEYEVALNEEVARRRNNSDETALQIAMDETKANEENLLRSFTNQRDPDGLTALHLAVSGRHHEVVTQLVAHRPQLLDAQSLGGFTPLHMAIRSAGGAVACCQARTNTSS